MEAVAERLALVAARGERALGRLAALRDGAQLRLGGAGRRAGRRDARLGVGERRGGGAGGVARERPARLVGLAREPLVQLRRLGLALERPQPRARLALDVERAVEVVLRALELELRAAPPLAVLAEPGRLLDQQPPVARLRRDDLRHPALGHDRVHLLAEAGVAQQLDHVGEAAAGAVDPVLALPRPVEPAHDRQLGQRQVDRAVPVVEHHLDLGLGARLDAVRAREDHVLHRLAADRDRRLLAERPQHRVGDVRLARPVRPDDHRDARGEVEPRAVRERLEALQADRPQVHVRPPRRPRARRRPPPARPPSSSGRTRARR